MKKYVCEVCGWVYDEALGDPEHGIAPGTKFEDLPADFECPLCGVGKDQFAEEYAKKTPLRRGLFAYSNFLLILSETKCLTSKFHICSIYKSMRFFHL